MRDASPDALIGGVKLDGGTLGTANGMLMVTASGTAVLAESVPLSQAAGQ